MPRGRLGIEGIIGLVAVALICVAIAYFRVRGYAQRALAADGLPSRRLGRSLGRGQARERHARYGEQLT